MGPATRIIRNSIASLPSIASRFTVCPCSSLGNEATALDVGTSFFVRSAGYSGSALSGEGGGGLFCWRFSAGAGKGFSHRAMSSIGQRYDSRNVSAGAAKKKDTYGGPSFMTMGNVFKKEFAFLWDTDCYVSLVDAMACLHVLSRSSLRPLIASLCPLIGAAAAASYGFSTGGGAMVGHASQALAMSEVVKTAPVDSFVFASQTRESGLETTGDVYGKPFLFLWDTGATASFIDLKVVDKLHLRYDKKVRHVVGVLDNSQFLTLGVCRIVWMMGGVRFTHQFNVIHGEGSLLLGTDFMRKFNRISFFFNEKEIIAVDKKNKTIKFTCV